MISTYLSKSLHMTTPPPSSQALFSSRFPRLFRLLPCLVGLTSACAEPPASTPASPPDSFPRFSIPAAPDTAASLNRFLRHHFDSRLHNDKVLFNKEYLMKADLWLHDAHDPRRQLSIQATHREDLLGIEISPDGYVHTHQHFSHTHDHGWPFPYWIQIPALNDEGNVVGRFQGLTAGWHFQEALPEWTPLTHLMRGTAGAERHLGDAATVGWELHHLESQGLVDQAWQLRLTGPSPTLTSPADVTLQADQAPFLQLRWSRSRPPPDRQLAFVEWMRADDTTFSSERRAYFPRHRHEEHENYSGGAHHQIIALHEHPLWTGEITRLRLHLAPGESDGLSFRLDSLFTTYDTRKQHNNPIFILASHHYFAWTGDLDFLQRQLPRLRLALRYLETEMGGREHGHIRNPWPGNDGRSALLRDADGRKQFAPGRGIGNNYYDLLPFGWDDAYATQQYHAALLAVAELEEAARQHPGWQIPLGAYAESPPDLRAHADRVHATLNRLFWDDTLGRYFGVIDRDGQRHDYGFVFLNLDAIWYGLAPADRARRIMDWIDGRRIIESDTSTGSDIYHWEFAPRATTKRNIEWYGQAWNMPEAIPFGGQIQDGGAVLGFSFYDLWARLQIYGPDDAWQRLVTIMRWDDRVIAAGGYRTYYSPNGPGGAAMQGANTAGAIGIDHEFFESSLLPAIIPRGFMGLTPTATALHIEPKLPAALPALTLHGLAYRGSRLDVTAEPRRLTVHLHADPAEALPIQPPPGWRLLSGPADARQFDRAGTYVFTPDGR